MFRISSSAIALAICLSVTGCVVTDEDLAQDDGMMKANNASSVVDMVPLPLLASTNSDDDALKDNKIVLINSKQELDALKSIALSANDQIDFETESVIIFSIGEQPEGSWCKILGISQEGQNINVLAQVNRPSAPTEFTIFPYAIATIKKVAGGNLNLDVLNLEDQPQS